MGWGGRAATTGCLMALMTVAGSATVEATPDALPGVEAVGSQVTVSWSIVVREPETTLRLYRGVAGGPLTVVTERRVPSGVQEGCWSDRVSAGGILVYQLRYVDEDGSEVVLGTRFGNAGAMDSLPPVSTDRTDDQSAMAAWPSGWAEGMNASAGPSLRAIAELFRPQPPDPVPRGV